ncbi:hypothetical protein D3C75_924630 [compost metagenome]
MGQGVTAAKTEETERLSVPFFQERAAGMLQEPVGFPACSQMCGGQLQHRLRVVLGDIVEIIGHTPAHIFRFILQKRRQDGKQRLRCGDQPPQGLAPR